MIVQIRFIAFPLSPDCFPLRTTLASLALCAYLCLGLVFIGWSAAFEIALFLALPLACILWPEMMAEIGKWCCEQVIMNVLSSPGQLEREWMAQWRRAGDALARVRADELASLTAVDALAATNALLALGVNVPLAEDRLTWSGLIDFQRYLHRRR
jgi:hypothetical protein